MNYTLYNHLSGKIILDHVDILLEDFGSLNNSDAKYLVKLALADPEKYSASAKFDTFTYTERDGWPISSAQDIPIPLLEIFFLLVFFQDEHGKANLSTRKKEYTFDYNIKEIAKALVARFVEPESSPFGVTLFMDKCKLEMGEKEFEVSCLCKMLSDVKEMLEKYDDKDKDDDLYYMRRYLIKYENNLAKYLENCFDRAQIKELLHRFLDEMSSEQNAEIQECEEEIQKHKAAIQKHQDEIDKLQQKQDKVYLGATSRKLGDFLDSSDSESD